jgi:hypothetical protein
MFRENHRGESDVLLGDVNKPCPYFAHLLFDVYENQY